MKYLIHLFLLVLVAILPRIANAQAAYKEIAGLKGGTVRGNVRFAGTPSVMPPLSIDRDVEVCGDRRSLQTLILGNNQGVQNAIVSLEGIKQGKPWKKEAVVVLDQQKCEYVPHVMIAPMGSEIEILNSDNILHNVHTYEHTGEMKTLFNIAQPIQGLRTKLALEKPGILLATCDAGHPWMSAFVRVTDHPYVVVSDKDGNFVMDNVPPGTYKIHLWHEPISVTQEKDFTKMQQHYFEKPIVVQKDVTVAAGGTVTVNFEFK